MSIRTILTALFLSGALVAGGSSFVACSCAQAVTLKQAVSAQLAADEDENQVAAEAVEANDSDDAQAGQSGSQTPEKTGEDADEPITPDAPSTGTGSADDQDDAGADGQPDPPAAEEPALTEPVAESVAQNDPGIPSHPKNRWAVIIDVPLAGDASRTEDDAKRVHATLIDAVKYAGVARDHVVVYADSDDASFKPTVENLKNFLDDADNLRIRVKNAEGKDDLTDLVQVAASNAGDYSEGPELLLFLTAPVKVAAGKNWIVSSDAKSKDDYVDVADMALKLSKINRVFAAVNLLQNEVARGAGNGGEEIADQNKVAETLRGGSGSNEVDRYLRIWVVARNKDADVRRVTNFYKAISYGIMGAADLDQVADEQGDRWVTAAELAEYLADDADLTSVASSLQNAPNTRVEVDAASIDGVSFVGNASFPISKTRADFVRDGELGASGERLARYMIRFFDDDRDKNKTSWKLRKDAVRVVDKNVSPAAQSKKNANETEEGAGK